MHQHIGQRGEVQPQLIGAQRFGAHAVGKQTELFFNAVLHLSASSRRALQLPTARGVRRSPRSGDSRLFPDTRLWPPPVVPGSSSYVCDKRTRQTRAPPCPFSGVPVSPPVAATQSCAAVARCEPSPTHSRLGSARTNPSALPGRTPNRHAR